MPGTGTSMRMVHPVRRWQLAPCSQERASKKQKSPDIVPSGRFFPHSDQRRDHSPCWDSEERVGGPRVDEPEKLCPNPNSQKQRQRGYVAANQATVLHRNTWGQKSFWFGTFGDFGIFAFIPYDSEEDPNWNMKFSFQTPHVHSPKIHLFGISGAPYILTAPLHMRSDINFSTYNLMWVPRKLSILEAMRFGIFRFWVFGTQIDLQP